MDNPTQERLKELFSYDPGTGLLLRIKRVSSCHAGDEAGTTNSYGYRIVWVDRKAIGTHRIAWIMCMGDIPAGMEIDHANGDRLDNRLSNLRLASRTQNSTNRKKHKNNRCGYKGVYFDDSRKRAKSWRARIVFNKKQLTLGMFATAQEAHEAYKKAALKYFGQFAKF